MDLKKMIDDLVEARLKESLASMFVDAKDNGHTAVAARIAEMDDDEMQPRRARKRGRGRAKVAYNVVAYRGRGRRPMPHMFPTLQLTWDAIKAAKGPITAREIEVASGLGKKTVESCVFQLRSHKLIRSVAVGAQ